MFSIRVDHMIVAVLDRDVAARDYNALGFKTIVGGTHPDGHTHNCLVPLAQGPYIELVSPTDVREIRVRHEDHNLHWLYCFNAGEGFAGYALGVPDIEPVVDRLKEKDYALNGPRRGGRVLPDGTQTLSNGINIVNPRYPAVSADITPREWRIPTTPENSTHDNGVTGVAHIIATVHNLEDGVQRYEALTGVQAEQGTPVPGARTADFQVENARLTIAEPTDPNTAMYEDLSLRGEVPFLIRLRTTSKSKIGLLDRTLTHHARFELVYGED
ncbi:MAG TPA: VOC family protein [Phototrophicaceae bacterium]|nr:VOC family protein [Phototrophicaceae bacterium]